MHWTSNVVEVGGGRVEHTVTSLRLFLPAATNSQYTDAQIDDTARRGRRETRVAAPPLSLSARARFSHPADELAGTAGLGFWNVPFGPGPARLPTLPQACWFFFGAPPHDVQLAMGVPGHGWKAMSLDAGRPAALKWIPFAPAALLAMQSQRLYQRIWPRIQQALAASEVTLPMDMRRWLCTSSNGEPTVSGSTLTIA